MKKDKKPKKERRENLEREVRDALWKQNQKDSERTGGVREYGEDPDEEQV
jgi:hypothetical protein